MLAKRPCLHGPKYPLSNCSRNERSLCGHGRRSALKMKRSLKFKIGDAVVFCNGNTGKIKGAGDIGNPYFDYDVYHYQRSVRILCKEKDLAGKLP